MGSKPASRAYSETPQPLREDSFQNFSDLEVPEEQDSIIVIMPFRYLSNDSINETEQPSMVDRRRATTSDVPQKPMGPKSRKRELENLMSFQKTFNMQLSPGRTKRPRKQSVYFEPPSKSSKKAPQAKKAPPQKAPPKKALPKKAPKPKEQNRSAPCVVPEVLQVDNNPEGQHHFGDEIFQTNLAKFREGIAKKSKESQPIVETPLYKLAMFPGTGTFSSCCGDSGRDARVTCYKMFPNSGILHMEPNTERKVSTTGSSEINFFIMTGTLTFEIYSSRNNLVKVLKLTPFSNLILNENVYYKIKNSETVEMFCFFLRESKKNA